MNKELILAICDSLIDQVTVVKGFIRLNNSNRKIDQSINLIQEMDNLEQVVRELINELMESIDEK